MHNTSSNPDIISLDTSTGQRRRIAVHSPLLPLAKTVRRQFGTSQRNVRVCKEVNVSETDESALLKKELMYMALMLLQDSMIEHTARTMTQVGLKTAGGVAGGLLAIAASAAMFDMMDVHGYGNMINRETLDSICKQTYENTLCQYQEAVTLHIQGFTQGPLGEDSGTSAARVQNALRSFTDEQRELFVRATSGLMFQQYVATEPAGCKPFFASPGYVKFVPYDQEESFVYGEPQEPCPESYIEGYSAYKAESQEWVAQSSPDDDQDGSGADPAVLTTILQRVLLKLSISLDTNSAKQEYATALQIVLVVAVLSLLAVIYFIYKKYRGER